MTVEVRSRANLGFGGQRRAPAAPVAQAAPAAPRELEARFYLQQVGIVERGWNGSSAYTTDTFEDAKGVHAIDLPYIIGVAKGLKEASVQSVTNTNRNGQSNVDTQIVGMRGKVKVYITGGITAAIALFLTTGVTTTARALTAPSTKSALAMADESVSGAFVPASDLAN